MCVFESPHGGAYIDRVSCLQNYAPGEENSELWRVDGCLANVDGHLRQFFFHILDVDGVVSRARIWTKPSFFSVDVELIY